jgi:hypothetical protein
MTRAERAIREIESEIGYSYDRRIVEAVCTEGLTAGDVIDLGVTAGEHMIATVSVNTVTIKHKGKKTVVAISDLTEAQVDRMIVNKAIRASRKS